jgi:hypothetical protein
MSQTVGKFVSALIVTGFDARFDESIGCKIKRADPVLAVPVVDVVPSVGRRVPQGRLRNRRRDKFVPASWLRIARPRLTEG